MDSCNDCQLLHSACICTFVDKFFFDNGHLMATVATPNVPEETDADRCLACFFKGCRCAAGLAAKP